MQRKDEIQAKKAKLAELRRQREEREQRQREFTKRDSATDILEVICTFHFLDQETKHYILGSPNTFTLEWSARAWENPQRADTRKVKLCWD